MPPVSHLSSIAISFSIRTHPNVLHQLITLLSSIIKGDLSTIHTQTVRNLESIYRQQSGFGLMQRPPVYQY